MSEELKVKKWPNRTERQISKLVRAMVSRRGSSRPILFVDGFAEPFCELLYGGWHITVGIGWVILALLTEEGEREAARKASKKTADK